MRGKRGAGGGVEESAELRVSYKVCKVNKVKEFMLNKEFSKVLTEVAEKLDESKIKWTLIGSTNLALQGMEFTPQDIDILASYNDIEIIKKLFSKFVIKESGETSNGECYEIKYLINSVEVQFCFEYSHGFYIKKIDQNGIIYKKFDLLNIPCFLLGDEAAAYRYLGRDGKAKMIEDFIKNANKYGK